MQEKMACMVPVLKIAKKPTHLQYITKQYLAKFNEGLDGFRERRYKHV
ncbi:hypothetical protein [Salipaludibacillus agaradhaerens]|nr:hypothetical protein [Salipaludibacillus agaradhaerens]